MRRHPLVAQIRVDASELRRPAESPGRRGTAHGPGRELPGQLRNKGRRVKPVLPERIAFLGKFRRNALDPCLDLARQPCGHAVFSVKIFGGRLRGSRQRPRHAAPKARGRREDLPVHAFFGVLVHARVRSGQSGERPGLGIIFRRRARAARVRVRVPARVRSLGQSLC